MTEEKTQAVYYRVTEQGVKTMTGPVIGESRWGMYVNGHEVVTFMATPLNLHHLALGFLISENLIAGMDDIASVRVNLAPDCAYWLIPALGLDETRTMPICEEGVGSIEIRLVGKAFTPPLRRIITSGCGGGTTFDDLSGAQPPLISTRQVSAAQIFAMMRELNQRAALYRECRGVHTSALCDGNQLLAVAEDVGRHNTLDKIRGECMLRGIPTQDNVLISTGRISSEMITKAAKMRVPIVASRTAATYLAIQLAQAWNMTLIGYARAGEMLVYAGVERIISSDQQSEEPQ